MINSEEFIKFQADQEQFAAQHIELYMRYRIWQGEGQLRGTAGQARQYS
jgi:hypothetical protein